MVEAGDEAGSRRRAAGVLALAVLSSVASAIHAAAGTVASPGCLDGGTPATVEQVEPPLDLRLDDGRLVRLAGIDPDLAEPPSSAQAGARARLSGWLDGQSIRVLPLEAAPDRWGRIRAAVFAMGSGGDKDHSVSVAEALLDAGLARARPAEGIGPCWTVYLRLESAARDDRRGSWGDPDGAVLSATDVPTLRGHLGRFAVVQGLVASIRDARGRAFLRFAGASPGAFTASVDRRTAQRLARDGNPPATWLDHRVRIRGVLDDRWGLAIDVTEPEQVEVLGP